MNDRPMHQPGVYERLARLYSEGEGHLAAGRFDDAIACFSQGLAIDDQFRQRYVTMYGQRAFALHRAGRFAEAIEDYGRALALEPEMHHGQYFMQRAMCFRNLEGRDREAWEDFTRAQQLNPDQPGPFHLRGKLNVDLGRWQEAVQDFDRLLTLRPHVEGYQLRALAKMNLGDHAGAMPDALEALRLSPVPYQHYLVACCAAMLGDEPRVVTHARAACEGDPSLRAAFVEDSEFARWQAWPAFRAAIGV